MKLSSVKNDLGPTNKMAQYPTLADSELVEVLTTKEKASLERIVARLIDRYDLSEATQIQGLSDAECLRTDHIGRSSLNLVRRVYPFDVEARPDFLCGLPAPKPNYEMLLDAIGLPDWVRWGATRVMAAYEFESTYELGGLTDKEICEDLGPFGATEVRKFFPYNSAIAEEVIEKVARKRERDRDREAERERLAALPINQAYSALHDDKGYMKAYEDLQERLDREYRIEGSAHVRSIRRLKALLPKIHEVAIHIRAAFDLHGVPITSSKMWITQADAQAIPFGDTIHQLDELGNHLVVTAIDSMLRDEHPPSPDKLLEILERTPPGFFFDHHEVAAVYGAIRAHILELRLEIDAAGAIGMLNTEISRSANLVFEEPRLSDMCRRAVLRWVRQRRDEGWLVKNSNRTIRQQGSAKD